VWLCGPLEVVAETRDIGQSNWGRLLGWADNDGHPHEWACPAELLGASDTAEFRRELMRNGLAVATNGKARTKLVDYVLTHKPSSNKPARCVTKTGWHGDRYILSAAAVGPEGEELVVYQGPVVADYATRGTLEGWQKEVAGLAVGNSRMMFAISCAFAGSLVDMAGESGGGFQLTGTTSKGKTSLTIDPAASVWGHPDQFARKWRSTPNGIEGLCLARNDNTLMLDDLGQADARECGAAAYLIANGQAKVRMHRDGGNRPVATWKTLLLSSGEVDLSQFMSEAGKVPRGGQMVRMPSIPADAGKNLGVLEELHGLADGRAFSDAVKAATRNHYGHAGMAWLEWLTEPATLASLRGNIRTIIDDAVKKLGVPEKSAPEVGRVAARFALVAVAGGLATKFGVTGWPKGHAFAAAKRCFSDWLEEAGGGMGGDDRALFARVRAFFEAHGSSRFEDINATSDQRINNRAGFYRQAGETRIYMVMPEAFKTEFAKGCTVKEAAEKLVAAGWLEPGKDGRMTHKPRIAGTGPTRVYVFTSKVWEDE
jgi:putative DNA primase/helicase